MNILLAHNSYQQAGGEDAVVESEHRLLSEHGHQLSMVTVSNDSVQGIWGRIQTAILTPYSRPAKRRFAEALAARRPDVVHIHNLFPLLSPSIYDACRDARVPVVQTLHNYRFICPGGLLLRDGRICELCIKGSAYQGALYGCYRNSRIGTLAVSRMIERHRKQRTWQERVDRYIAVSKFAKAKFVEAGMPGDRIVVKPNFAPDRLPKALPPDRSGALFVGRLSPEKGIRTLLSAWRDLDVPLDIVGDGPLMDEVRRAGGPGVTVHGWMDAEDVSIRMRRAAFLVMPSESYETFGMTLVEGFCQALPAIASGFGAMAEIVDDGVTGLHFVPGDARDLAAKVRWAGQHPEEINRMGDAARKQYEANYTPERNYSMLMAVYEQAIDAASGRDSPSHGACGG